MTIIAGVSAFPHPIAQGPPAGGVGGLPIPREGQYGADNYFQYINVPGPNTFEWGYRRGNPKHNREEYLSQKDHTFKAKVEVKKVSQFMVLLKLEWFCDNFSLPVTSIVFGFVLIKKSVSILSS